MASKASRSMDFRSPDHKDKLPGGIPGIRRNRLENSFFHSTDLYLQLWCRGNRMKKPRSLTYTQKRGHNLCQRRRAAGWSRPWGKST
jgi:hypothetical protein